MLAKVLAILLMVWGCMGTSWCMAQDDDDGTGLYNTGNGMAGMYGTYDQTRESSGTSWQPEATPLAGWSASMDDWTFQLNGMATFDYNHQTGPRGEDQFFSTNLLWIRAAGTAGPGVLGVRTLFSLEPTLGSQGFSELLQTGGSADDRTPLVDRQYPLDLVDELALSYTFNFTNTTSLFVYLGYPGEPALGPTFYRERFSSMEDPLTPITHQWLDSTAVSYGVATLGLAIDGIKLEGSAFNGHNIGDSDHWGFDAANDMKSYSGRLTLNPFRGVSIEASMGHLVGPYSFAPGQDEDRANVAVSLAGTTANTASELTVAWGRRMFPGGGTASDGYLAEYAVNAYLMHTLFLRAERVDEAATPTTDITSGIFDSGRPGVYEGTIGYIFDLPNWNRVTLGLGGLATVSVVPSELQAAYGSNSPVSFVLFTRLKLI